MKLPQFKKPSRQGRYRKVIIPPHSLLPFTSKLEKIFAELDQHRLKKLISDAEFLTYGLLTLLACRPQNAFQVNRSRVVESPLQQASTSLFLLSDYWKLIDKHAITSLFPFTNYHKIFDQKIFLDEFLFWIRFKGIPDAARLALMEWLKQKYPLTLFFHIPSSTEVFELQKQGGRCVSFFKDAHSLGSLHHERDVISFIVHDLIHAHEFYAHPQRAKQQIGFYHWLDSIKNNSLVLKLLSDSEEFKERWQYVLSDMNSYCGHLLKTLHAAFIICAQANDGEEIWKNIMEASNLNTHEKILFSKINSPNWSEKEFLQLEITFENIFQTQTSIFINTASSPLI